MLASARAQTIPRKIQRMNRNWNSGTLTSAYHQPASVSASPPSTGSACQLAEPSFSSVRTTEKLIR